jgi:hypothetical protein
VPIKDLFYKTFDTKKFFLYSIFIYVLLNAI